MVDGCLVSLFIETTLKPCQLCVIFFNNQDTNHKHRLEEKSQQSRRYLSTENGRWMSGFPVYKDNFEALSCVLFSSITKT